MSRKNLYLWLSVGAILLAALLRWLIIPAMRQMMTTDEAYYLLDAVSLVEVPRFTPFFPGNYGREAAFMYLLAPFTVGLGDWLFAGRVVAAFIAVVAVALTGRLGADLFGWKGGVFSAVAMATLYWHVHMSHLVFRAMLMVPAGALAFLLFWRAAKHGGRKRWVLAGLALAFLFYTYFSARAWMGLIAGLMVLVAWRRPAIRRDAAVGLFVAGLACVPMLIYMVQNPDASIERMRDVGTFDLGTIFGNVLAWLRAPLGLSDPNPGHTLLNRPLFDLAEVVMIIAGGVALIRVKNLRLQEATIGLMLLAALSPSLVSNYAPHYLRAVGATLPFGLIIGVGASALFDHVTALGSKLGASPLGAKRIAATVLTAASMFTAYATGRDIYVGWLGQPESHMAMEEGFSSTVDVLLRKNVSGQIVYFSPYLPAEALVRFAGRKLHADTATFNPEACVTVEDRPFWLVSKVANEQLLLRRLGEVATVVREGVYPSPQAYSPMGLYTVTARPPSWEKEVVFGDRVGLSLIPPSSSMAPGSAVDVFLQMRGRSPMFRPHSASIQIYSAVTSLNGPKVAQVDSWLCPPNPTTIWNPSQTYYQHFVTQLPPTLAPGEYEIYVTVYESETNAVLPANVAGAQVASAFMGRITVR